MLGTFVSLAADKLSLTMTDAGGTLPGTHALSAHCTVTLDGKVVQLAQLRPGDLLELSGQPATAIKATRPPLAKAAKNAF